MLRPIQSNRRLSKKASRAAEGDTGGSSAGPRPSVDRVRDELGAEAHRPEGVGTPRTKTHCALSQTLQIALPLQLRGPRERGGLLANPPEGRGEGVLCCALPLCKRGGSREGQARPAGLGPGWLAHRRGGRGARRDTPSVPACSLPRTAAAERLWPLATASLAKTGSLRTSTSWKRRSWSAAWRSRSKPNSSAPSRSTTGGLVQASNGEASMWKR
jgi:hypothetical protein